MLKKAIVLSIPSIILNFIIPFIAGYFILPLPTDQLSNGIATGLGGAIASVFAAIPTLYIYMKKEKE